MSVKSRKIAGYILLCCLIAGAVVLCVVRWDAWFGNVPEEPYTPQSTPHNIVLTYNQNALSERIVSWRADTAVKHSALILVGNQYSLDREQQLPDTLMVFPTDTLIESRGGKAAYYRSYLYDLEEGETYRYQICSDTLNSEWFEFTVPSDNELEFMVFGDVQDNMENWSASIFQAVDTLFPDADFWSFVGDIIERPTDAYWQYWFSSMGDVTARRPIVAATGNHEYLKGVIKRLDPRWTCIFGNPDNGPSRGIGTSYYIDFPQLRFIVIDTDGLDWFSDYTITSAWLRRITQNTDVKRWNIVMMHHPIYSASSGRENVILHTLLRRSLKNVDLVLQGHDHTYSRRFTRHDGRDCTPVYIETTTAHKYYLPKVSPRESRIITNHPVYNRIRLTGDKLDFETYIAESNELYDHFTIEKNDSSTIITDLAIGMPEIIELPERYKDRNGSDIRRFRNRTAERLKARDNEQ